MTDFYSCVFRFILFHSISENNLKIFRCFLSALRTHRSTLASLDECHLWIKNNYTFMAIINLSAFFIFSWSHSAESQIFLVDWMNYIMRLWYALMWSFVSEKKNEISYSFHLSNITQNTETLNCCYFNSFRLQNTDDNFYILKWVENSVVEWREKREARKNMMMKKKHDKQIELMPRRHWITKTISHMEGDDEWSKNIGVALKFQYFFVIPVRCVLFLRRV